MPRLFSAYVIVDWSAASKPTTGADSIWVGVLKRDVRFRMAFESHNPATRAEAEKLIAGILDDRAKRSDNGGSLLRGLPPSATRAAHGAPLSPANGGRVG